MEKLNCICKGIRICNSCKDIKKEILENKNLNKEKTILLDSLVITEEIEDKINNQKIQKTNNYRKIFRFYIPKSSYSNKNNLILSIKENEFLINKILEENKKEIIQESKTNLYYEYLINYFDSDLLFNGFYVVKNFLDETEQNGLIEKINENSWNYSQSGRKKQDYGPKINYKKKKIKIEEINFEININKKKFDNLNENEEDLNKIKNDKKIKYENLIFPYLNSEKCNFYEFLDNKIKELNLLQDFKISEIGNLFYDKSKGGHIEPHIDDGWIWGKRIIGINLLSETKITFSKEIQDHKGNLFSFEIIFPIEKGDLYIMTDLARYLWKHSIKQEHILNDRIVVTLREFEENFLQNFIINSLI